MRRQHLAIFGTEVTNHTSKLSNGEREVRLSLVLDKSGQPEWLHSDKEGAAGRYARVVRGYLGEGKLPKPVAIKLERQEINPNDGRAKFEAEYAAQHLVHKNVAEGEHTRVVRMLELWKLEENQKCDELAPTLICRQSRRIVAPKCRCGQELLDDFRCPTMSCSRSRKAPGSKVDVQSLRELIRNDSVCGTCDANSLKCDCYWLNYRPCKLIVLELLDVDLGEFATWHWRKQPPATSRPARKKYEDDYLPSWTERINLHGDSKDELTKELVETEFILNLYFDAINGVQELHKNKIQHLDIKPGNLCLNLSSPFARLKVIDLGQALSPILDFRTSRQSIKTDSKPGERDPVYSAPEQLPTRHIRLPCKLRLQENSCQIAITTSQPDAVDILTGDCLEVFQPGGEFGVYRIVSSKANKDRLEFHAVKLNTDGSMSSTIEDAKGNAQNWTSMEVTLIKSAGESADIFSLGMLLLFLITKGSVQLSQFRGVLGDLEPEFARLASSDSFKTSPVRSLVQELIRRQPEALSLLKVYLETVPSLLRSTYEELIGIAFQAVFRGAPERSYTNNRGDYPEKTLSRMKQDVRSVYGRLRVLLRAHELLDGRVALTRKAQMNALRDWLKQQGTNINQRVAKGSNLPLTSPKYDRKVWCEALDYGSMDEVRSRLEFGHLLHRYRYDTEMLKTDLDLFELELNSNQLQVDGLHPVMVDAIKLLKTGSGSLKALSPDTSKSLRDAIASTHNSLAPLKRIVDQALTVGWLRFTDNDFKNLSSDKKSLELAIQGFKQYSKALIVWLEGACKDGQVLINRWERLDEIPAFKEFGKDVSSQLQQFAVNTEQWALNTNILEKWALSLSNDFGKTLIDSWPERRNRDRWSVPGIWRRLVAWIKRKDWATKMEIAPLESQRMSNKLEAVEKLLTDMLILLEKLCPPPHKTTSINKS